MVRKRSKNRSDGYDSPGTRSAETKSDATGPTPNPGTNLLLADIALRSTSMLVRRGLERGLLGKRYSSRKAENILKGRSMTETLAGVAIARLATRSVPGALIVGGGMIAKTLYDRRKGMQARIEGEAKISDMAEEGADRDTGEDF